MVLAGGASDGGGAVRGGCMEEARGQHPSKDAPWKMVANSSGINMWVSRPSRPERPDQPKRRQFRGERKEESGERKIERGKRREEHKSMDGLVGKPKTTEAATFDMFRFVLNH